MSSYFYALVELPEKIEDSYNEEDIIEFFSDDDGFDSLVRALNNIRVSNGMEEMRVDKTSSIKMLDISSHGVFIRPREVGIDTGFYAGDAGCFVHPSELRGYVDHDYDYDDSYELKMIAKYEPQDALMFIM